MLQNKKLIGITEEGRKWERKNYITRACQKSEGYFVKSELERNFIEIVVAERERVESNRTKKTMRQQKERKTAAENPTLQFLLSQMKGGKVDKTESVLNLCIVNQKPVKVVGRQKNWQTIGKET